jgi:Zn-finger nucleic acid-binding protein
MRECPHCRTNLHEIIPGGIKYDECSSCGGLFYDEDELRRAKDQALPDANWLDFDLFREAKEHPSDDGIRCPKCSAGMTPVQYRDSGVTVDVCTKCKGVWLDKEEFSRILEHLDRAINSMTLPAYIVASIKQGIEILLRKESFISEWKDFTKVVYLMSLRGNVD